VGASSASAARAACGARRRGGPRAARAMAGRLVAAARIVRHVRGREAAAPRRKKARPRCPRGCGGGENDTPGRPFLSPSPPQEAKFHSVSGRKAGAARFSRLLAESDVLQVETSCPWPGWQTRVRARGTRADDGASCNLDESWGEEDEQGERGGEGSRRARACAVSRPSARA